MEIITLGIALLFLSSLRLHKISGGGYVNTKPIFCGEYLQS